LRKNQQTRGAGGPADAGSVEVNAIGEASKFGYRPEQL